MIIDQKIDICQSIVEVINITFIFFMTFSLFCDMLITFVNSCSKGEMKMGETGKKDKGKKEQKKKPKLTIKEKRKQKNEKKETV